MVLRHICNCMRKPACRIRDLTVATCEGATFGGCDGKHSPEVDERASATLEYVEGGGTAGPGALDTEAGWFKLEQSGSCKSTNSSAQLPEDFENELEWWEDKWTHFPPFYFY